MATGFFEHPILNSPYAEPTRHNAQSEDGHDGYLQAAQFYDDVARLDQIDWDALQRRDFRRDPDNAAKFERYEAEALAQGHVPVEALLGVTCYNKLAHDRIAVAGFVCTGIGVG